MTHELFVMLLFVVVVSFLTFLPPFEIGQIVQSEAGFLHNFDNGINSEYSSV